MSYREQDGQVILTMSREEEIEQLAGYLIHRMTQLDAPLFWRDRRRWMMLGNALFNFLADRPRQGNPHYTPYQVEAEKK